MGLAKNWGTHQNRTGFSLWWSSFNLVLISLPKNDTIGCPRMVSWTCHVTCHDHDRRCNDDISCITAEVMATGMEIQINCQEIEQTFPWKDSRQDFVFQISCHSTNSEGCFFFLAASALPNSDRNRFAKPSASQLRWTVSTTAGCPRVTVRGASRISCFY